MEKRVAVAVVLLALGVAVACGKSPRHAPFWSKLNRLGSWMTGSFRFERGEGAPALRLYVVEIWPERKGAWLYAEWVAEGAPELPLRQHVFQVLGSQAGAAGEPCLYVYKHPEPERIAGTWNDPRRIAPVKERDLQQLVDCTLSFESFGTTRMVGMTEGAGCELPGAGEAQSLRLEVTMDRLTWQGLAPPAGEEANGRPAGSEVYTKTANGPFR